MDSHCQQKKTWIGSSKVEEQTKTHVHEWLNSSYKKKRKGGEDSFMLTFGSLFASSHIGGVFGFHVSSNWDFWMWSWEEFVSVGWEQRVRSSSYVLLPLEKAGRSHLTPRSVSDRSLTNQCFLFKLTELKIFSLLSCGSFWPEQPTQTSSDLVIEDLGRSFLTFFDWVWIDIFNLNNKWVGLGWAHGWHGTGGLYSNLTQSQLIAFWSTNPTGTWLDNSWIGWPF